MFNKKEFADILNRINMKYDSMTEFSKKAALDRTYISKYINLKLNNPPSPDILKKIADNSYNITDYISLLHICGYLDDSVYNKITLSATSEIIESESESLKKLGLSQNDINYLSNFLSAEFLNEEDFNDSMKKITRNIKKNDITIFIRILKNIGEKINLTLNTNYLKYLNNLTILNNLNKYYETKYSIKSNVVPLPDTPTPIPVLGKISAGLPLLAVENIEGYDFAPSRNLKTDYDYFYLIVNGDSMNLKFKDGDRVLVQKQECLENGEIGVIMVNGDDATVKRFRKENGIIILEPMSSNPEHHVQMYNPEQIQIRIIGKVILSISNVN